MGTEFLVLGMRRPKILAAVHPNFRPCHILAGPIMAGLGLTLAGCGGGVFDPQGPIAAAESNILIDSIAIMLAIIVPTMIGTIVFAWWFRASNSKAKYRPDWAYSGRVEMVVWSVPLLTIIFLGGITWVGAHQLDPAVPIPSDKKALQVQVVALDWKWLFIYPDQHVASLNQLVVPVGTPVHFSLTSSSVWNSFFVPRLGSMIYTMKGMTTQLHLMADEEGTYHGLSTHFSGDGFADMNFDVKSVSDGAFDAWVEAARGQGPVLDEAAYKGLLKQSTAEPPRTFREVDMDLFGKITTLKLPAGPGPSEGPAPDVTPKGGS